MIIKSFMHKEEHFEVLAIKWLDQLLRISACMWYLEIRKR